ncbi:MAG: hypothetical protein AAFN30_06175 [Actinomycetota bacterium]
MSLQTAPRPADADLAAVDRSYYADLWGTTGAPARARRSWHRRRAVSAWIAIACAIALLVYVAATASVGLGI